MAAYVKRSVSYAAFLYPGGSNEGRINIYCEQSNRLYILFKESGAALPANSFNEASKTGVAYESIDRYAHYVDLLRNEAPVWVTFRSDGNFVVYCSGEPVGEEES